MTPPAYLYPLIQIIFHNVSAAVLVLVLAVVGSVMLAKKGWKGKHSLPNEQLATGSYHQKQDGPDVETGKQAKPSPNEPDQKLDNADAKANGKETTQQTTNVEKVRKRSISIKSMDDPEHDSSEKAQVNNETEVEERKSAKGSKQQKQGPGGAKRAVLKPLRKPPLKDAEVDRPENPALRDGRSSSKTNSRMSEQGYNSPQDYSRTQGHNSRQGYNSPPGIRVVSPQGVLTVQPITSQQESSDQPELQQQQQHEPTKVHNHTRISSGVAEKSSVLAGHNHESHGALQENQKVTHQSPTVITVSQAEGSVVETAEGAADPRTEKSSVPSGHSHEAQVALQKNQKATHQSPTLITVSQAEGAAVETAEGAVHTRAENMSIAVGHSHESQVAVQKNKNITRQSPKVINVGQAQGAAVAAADNATEETADEEQDLFTGEEIQLSQESEEHTAQEMVESGKQGTPSQSGHRPKLHKSKTSLPYAPVQETTETNHQMFESQNTFMDDQLTTIRENSIISITMVRSQNGPNSNVQVQQEVTQTHDVMAMVDSGAKSSSKKSKQRKAAKNGGQKLAKKPSQKKSSSKSTKSKPSKSDGKTSSKKSADSVRSGLSDKESTISKLSNKTMKLPDVEPNKVDTYPIEIDRPLFQKSNPQDMDRPLFQKSNTQDMDRPFFQKSKTSLPYISDTTKSAEFLASPDDYPPTAPPSETFQKMPDIYMRNYLISQVINFEGAEPVNYQTRMSMASMAWNIPEETGGNREYREDFSPNFTTPPSSNPSTADSNSVYVSESIRDVDVHHTDEQEEPAGKVSRPRGANPRRKAATKNIYKPQVG